MGEVLTLQFGTFSNFVGAHYWNLEAEKFNPRFFLIILRYDEDKKTSEELIEILHFSRQEGTRVVYNPRVLVFDLKGGHSPRSIHSCHSTDESTAWAGSVETVQRENRPVIPFQEVRHTQRTGDLPVYAQKPTSQVLLDDMIFRSCGWNFEEQVELWSDFNQADYHPRSIWENTSHFASDSTFDVFSYGFANPDQLEEYLDAFRYFTEACNRPQGVQVLLDTDSGYGALAQQLLTEIADDFGLPLAVTGLTPFSENATPKTYTPISCQNWTNVKFPLFRFDYRLPYHASAVIASALHTSHLPWRNSPAAFRSTYGLLRAAGPLTSLSFAFLSLPLDQPNPYAQVFAQPVASLTQMLSPGQHQHTPAAQVLALAGGPMHALHNYFHQPFALPRSRLSFAAHQNQLLPVSFPSAFSQSLTEFGSILQPVATDNFRFRPLEIPTLASLEASGNLEPYMTMLCQRFNGLDMEALQDEYEFDSHQFDQNDIAETLAKFSDGLTSLKPVQD